MKIGRPETLVNAADSAAGSLQLRFEALQRWNLQAQHSKVGKALTVC